MGEDSPEWKFSFKFKGRVHEKDNPKSQMHMDYVCWEEQGTEPWRKQHPCGSLAWDMLPDGLVIAQGKGETESHVSRPRQALRNS